MPNKFQKKFVKNVEIGWRESLAQCIASLPETEKNNNSAKTLIGSRILLNLTK